MGDVNDAPKLKKKKKKKASGLLKHLLWVGSIEWGDTALPQCVELNWLPVNL